MFLLRQAGGALTAICLFMSGAQAQNAQQLQQMQQQRMQQMQQMQQQRAIQQQQMQQQRAVQQQQQIQQQRMQQMQQQRAIQQQQMQQQRAVQQQQQLQQQRAIQQQQQMQQQRAIQQQQIQQQRAVQQQQQSQQQQRQFQQRQQVQPAQPPQQPFQQGRPPRSLGQPNVPGSAPSGIPQPGIARPGIPQPGLRPVQPGIPPANNFGQRPDGRPDPRAIGSRPAGPVGIPTGQPGGFSGPAPVDLRALREQRRVRTENDGRTRIIQEPGLRTIVRQDNRMIIRGDDRNRFMRFGSAQTMRRQDGSNVSILNRPGGVQIVSVYDQYGRLIERRRRGGGRDFVFFSNRRARGLAVGALIAAPLILAPLAYSMPRERYIVDYDDAPPELLYDALSAPPVQSLERRYTVDEVLYNQGLRDRMRRVDLNEINFASGSWEVPPQYHARLGRIAQAMLRVIQRNPREVFLVEGHTDATGTAEDNLTLSDRRAEAIAIILTEQFQVPPENLLVQGYGEQNLKVQTDGPEPRNRRVSIRRITPLLSQAQQQ